MTTINAKEPCGCVTSQHDHSFEKYIVHQCQVHFWKGMGPNARALALMFETPLPGFTTDEWKQMQDRFDVSAQDGWTPRDEPATE